MRLSPQINRSGFTFVEVMIASAIFVGAAATILVLARGSVKAVKDAHDVTTATYLLEQTMVELETKLEVEGFDKACDKKKEGKYDAPYEAFTYVTYCDQIDFHFSEATSQLLGTNKDDKNSSSNVTTEDMIKKQILDIASDYISKSMRELHVEVMWKQGKTDRHVDATTHYASYDQPFQMPGTEGAPPASGSSSGSSSGASSGTSSGSSSGSSSGPSSPGGHP